MCRLMEKLQPFERKIHADELWLYKNPVTESYVPSKMLWVLMAVYQDYEFLMILSFLTANCGVCSLNCDICNVLLQT